MAITMRKTIKVVFLIASTLALVLCLSSISISIDQKAKNSSKTTNDHQEEDYVNVEEQPLLLPSRRVSRFLAQTGDQGSSSSGRNPNAADHCNKDNEICSSPIYGRNATCCNNKCMDLSEDSNNCGACKNKCKFTQHCCNGECVNLSYDKRNCGVCNNKCMPGGYCIYGMCDYA